MATFVGAEYIIANKGIDLNNLIFTPSLPPATANAMSKFPSDYQQVYLLNSGNDWRDKVVYLPGINNPNVSWDSTDKWKEKTVEKWPRKQLLNNIIEVLIYPFALKPRGLPFSQR